MDADTLRMLADLGLDRREVLSAPTGDEKGHGYRSNLHEEADILANEEARRHQQTRDRGGSSRDVAIRAWNSKQMSVRRLAEDQLTLPQRRPTSSKMMQQPSWKITCLDKDIVQD